MPLIQPCAAVIPTRHRIEPLRRTFESLLEQETLPADLIIVDGSDQEENRTRDLCDQFRSQFTVAGVDLVYQRAVCRGAASQRNEGVAATDQPFILFLDDDILLEARCIERLFNAIDSDSKIGAVSSMITNQKFELPGRLGRLVGRIVSASSCHQKNWPGRYLGPAFTMLPDDDPALPEIVPVEWLNTTCTLYRTEALPSPPFPDFFYGGSFAEDFALSQLIRRDWKLANARTARIFHDSQPGDHKRNAKKIAAETAANWLRIMHHVTHETRRRDRARLAIVLAYRAMGNAFGPSGLRNLIPTLAGYLQGWRDATSRP
ncbi:MAG: glycosyltransferase [Verrucomicrobiales bacterium]|nr:glycosyltransferase [Verrucomicrobiales bacterium]